MRTPHSRMPLLLAHGLNESEARVYLALLDAPSQTASALAQLANVPRSHLYKVLQDLHQQGLVDMLLEGSARAYRARPFSLFLEQKAQEMRARLSETEQELRTVAQSLQPPPLAPRAQPDLGEMRLVSGRAAVAREVDEMLERAKAHVVVASSDGGLKRVARQLEPWVERWKRLESPPRVEVLVPTGADVEAFCRRLDAASFVTIRMLRVQQPVLSWVIDAAGMVMIHPRPDTSEVRSGCDFAVFSSDPAFVAAQLGLLEVASTPSECARSTGDPEGATAS